MTLIDIIANAGFSIAMNLNPMGALGDVQTLMDISQEIHATAKSLDVNIASWERAVADQYEFQNGKHI